MKNIVELIKKKVLEEWEGIDVIRAATGLPKSEILTNVNQMISHGGGILGLEGVKGSTPILNQLAKNMMLLKDTLVRNGRGEISAAVVVIHNLPDSGGRGALLTNGTTNLLQVGKAKGDPLVLDEKEAMRLINWEIQQSLGDKKSLKNKF